MGGTFLKGLAARIAHIGRGRGLRADVPAVPDVPDPSRREFIRAGVGVVGGLAVAAVAPRLAPYPLTSLTRGLRDGTTPGRMGLAAAAPLITSPGHSGQHGLGHSGTIPARARDTKRMAYDPGPSW